MHLTIMAAKGSIGTMTVLYVALAPVILGAFAVGMERLEAGLLAD